MNVSKLDKKTIRSLLTMAVVIILIVVGIGFCSGGANKVTKDKVRFYYRVNHATNLYDAADIDANVIGFFEVGDELTIPGGKLHPECTTIYEPDVSKIELCYLYSPKHKDYGWVLKKWLTIERD